jgi:hypothetical protein
MFARRPRHQPPPPNPEPTPETISEAGRIWEATPTPVFDEFNSKRKYLNTDCRPGHDDLHKDETLFYTYVQKLKEKYSDKLDFKWNFNPEKTYQPFQASCGGNYYRQFKTMEKSVQLNLNGGDFMTLAGRIQSDKDAKRLNAEQKAREEKERYNAVPTGNLLELNKPKKTNNDPNLIKFNRAKELEGLFGGKRRKSRKSRKNHKNRTRRN